MWRKITHFKAEVERIEKMLDRWDHKKEISVIECDILLQYLRQFYQEVLLLAQENAEPLSLTHPQAQGSSSVYTPHAESSAGASVERLEIDDSATTREPFTEGDAEPTSIVAVSFSATDTAPLEQESFPATLNVSTPSPAKKGLIEPQKKSIPQEMTDPAAATPAPAYFAAAEQQLFSEESLPKARVDKQVILSLYGQQSGQSVQAASNRTDSSLHSSPADPSPSNFPAQRPTPGATRASGAPKVLGEVLGGATPAFNEVYGQSNTRPDMATKIRSRIVTDLRQAIGINDRFLMIKELFEGDGRLFESTISQLNGCENLDEAMIYIQENFHWQPDGESVAFLIDLLERKFEG